MSRAIVIRRAPLPCGLDICNPSTRSSFYFHHNERICARLLGYSVAHDVPADVRYRGRNSGAYRKKAIRVRLLLMRLFGSAHFAGLTRKSATS